MTSGPGGLSPDALLVYRCLSDRLEVLADDLPALVGLPRHRVEDGVGGLVQSGLARVVRLEGDRVRVELGSIAAVRAILDSPEVGVLPAAAVRLLRARVVLGDMLAPEASGPQVEKLYDHALIRERLGRIGEQTRRELFSLHAGDPMPAEWLDAHLADDLELIRRGVDVYTVYPTSFLSLEHVRRYAAALEEAGAHVRFADALPHRLIISDRVRAVVPLDTSDTVRGALVTTEASICRSLHHLATSIYRRGRAAGDVDPADPGGPPSPLERRVLLLMSSGATDLVAAKQLGVTDRTFRRYAADLLARLGATSRFQAGAKAVERGWI